MDVGFMHITTVKRPSTITIRKQEIESIFMLKLFVRAHNRLRLGCLVERQNGSFSVTFMMKYWI